MHARAQPNQRPDPPAPDEVHLVVQAPQQHVAQRVAAVYHAQRVVGVGQQQHAHGVPLRLGLRARVVELVRHAAPRRAPVAVAVPVGVWPRCAVAVGVALALLFFLQGEERHVQAAAHLHARSARVRHAAP